MTDRIKFTVYRDKWRRGAGPRTALLLDDGQRCCLGFLGRACGIQDDDMIDIADPESVASKHTRALWPRVLLNDRGQNTRFTDNVIEENDSDDFDSEELREVALSALFADFGIDVEFLDGEQP